MIAKFVMFVLSVLWIYLLFRIGQKDKHSFLFYILIYAPLIIPFVLISLVYWQSYFNVLSMLSVWGIFVLIAFVLERIGWGITLKEISGEDELVWFYFVYSIPLFGWLFYLSVKIR